MRRWIAIPSLALVLSACGGSAPQGSPVEPDPEQPVHTIAGNLVDAAEMEPVGRQSLRLPANGTREIPLEFGGAEAGSVIVITDQPEDVRASVGGVPLHEGDLLGVPAYFLILSHPGGSKLRLVNASSAPAAIEVDLLAKTARRIQVRAEPSAVEPGGIVTLTAEVSEPTDADVVRITVVRNHQTVTELEPERVDKTTWRVSYEAPETGGFYAVGARVEGGPPRAASGVVGFEVAHHGTRIARFEDRAIDSDGDGLINWLVIKLHLEVSAAGKYLLIAALTDSAGTSLPVGGGSGDVLNLRPGVHVAALRWSGSSLRATGTPGPYGIAHVQLTRVEPSYRTETDIAELGKTRAWELSDFDTD